MSEYGKKKNVLGKNLRPPDGGWGWMVICGAALSHIFLIPMLQSFTLLFRERFIELEFTSTDITTVVSLNASFGMILGIMNGPLLKIFGYRKLALVGATAYVVGNLCTGVASSYAEFVIYYGMLSSIGLIMTMASYSLAINSYFQKNRSKAFSYAMTLTGLGPIILPIVISELLSSYGLKWTVFILAGLTLNMYVGALLLHPVKWHMKVVKEAVCQVEEKKSEEDNVLYVQEVNSFLDLSICETKSLSLQFGSVPAVNARSWWSQDSLLKLPAPRLRDYLEPCLKKEKEDWECQKKLSVTFLDNEDYKNMMNSTLRMIENVETSAKNLKYASAETLSLQNLDNLLVYEKQLVEPLKPQAEEKAFGKDGMFLENVRSGLFARCIRFLKDIYDVDLLHDAYFINIMVGLSIALVGEVIFSSMTPFIFKEVGFNTEDTAKLMAIIASSDLIFRLIAPYAGKVLKLNSKMMYLLALILLLLSRASLFLASNFETYSLVSFCLGIGKGFRSVFWVLVIPEHVPLSKLPSASAFQSLANGIMLLVSGPVTGAVIAINNRYTNLIITSNVLTLITILLWSGEWLFLKYRKKRKNQDSGLSS